MKKLRLLVCCLSMLPLAAMAQKSAARGAVSRPPILGISHIAVYATDPIKTADFYQRIVGCEKMADFEDHPGVRYTFTPFQYVEVLPRPPGAGSNRLDHIAFRTNDVEAMRRYLQAHGVPTPNQISVSQGPD